MSQYFLNTSIIDIKRMSYTSTERARSGKGRGLSTAGVFLVWTQLEKKEREEEKERRKKEKKKGRRKKGKKIIVLVPILSRAVAA